MHSIDHAFSDLLRHPNDVIDDLADADVVLRRRGSPALRLSRVDRDEARDAAFSATTRLLRILAVHDRDAVTEALREVFPWSAFLPPKDRHDFVEEITTMLLGSAEIGIFVALSQLLSEWRGTAEVHADPKLAKRLRRKLSAAGGAVPLPRR